MKCERCHSEAQGYNLFDYCAVCSANLCPHCMAEGCCGNVPAVSGMEADDGEAFEAAEHSVKRTGLNVTPHDVALHDYIESSERDIA